MLIRRLSACLFAIFIGAGFHYQNSVWKKNSEVPPETEPVFLFTHDLPQLYFDASGAEDPSFHLIQLQRSDHHRPQAEWQAYFKNQAQHNRKNFILRWDIESSFDVNASYQGTPSLLNRLLRAAEQQNAQIWLNPTYEINVLTELSQYPQIDQMKWLHLKEAALLQNALSLNAANIQEHPALAGIILPQTIEPSLWEDDVIRNFLQTERTQSQKIYTSLFHGLTLKTLISCPKPHQIKAFLVYLETLETASTNHDLLYISPSEERAKENAFLKKLAQRNQQSPYLSLKSQN